MFSLKIRILFGTITVTSLAYIYYIRRCYKYLKSLGYDGPKPKMFIGNLTEFNSTQNSTKSIQISHYSKTLQRWTKTYGKIYGYYEGHTPILVIADPDLVSEVFLNQNKLLSHRRTFPMSKRHDEPDSDIFLSHGVRWLRVRYGLEKVMLNNKNLARCLEYADIGFLKTFHQNQKNLEKRIDIHQRVKILMVKIMFSVIFGMELENFVSQNELKLGNDPAQIVATKFKHAFENYEGFSLLKLLAVLIPELSFMWRNLEKSKQIFNSYIFRLNYFANPMDWFYSNFINKHLMSYEKNETQADESRKFGYFNSFLFLTYNPIIKYNQNETSNRKVSVLKDLSGFSGNEENKKLRTLSESRPRISSQRSSIKSRHFSSADATDLKRNKKVRIKSFSSSFSNLNELPNEEFEDWKLTIEEALSNTLLMFFAGFETTSSAIAFCSHVINKLPEQKFKLIEEIKENWKALSFNLDKYGLKKGSFYYRDEMESEFSAMSDTDFNDDVFEEADEDPECAKPVKKKPVNQLEHWNDLYESLEKMKYLDMFVREVLRMFPIANSMVSRKCAVEGGMYVNNGAYFIPFGMNVVVDVLSIHYDPVTWGPIDPNVFYPERFLTERNPAAWLPFGIIFSTFIQYKRKFSWTKKLAASFQKACKRLAWHKLAKLFQAFSRLVQASKSLLLREALQYVY